MRKIELDFGSGETTISMHREPQELASVRLTDDMRDECIAGVKKAVMDSGAADIDKLEETLKTSVCGNLYTFMFDIIDAWANASQDESPKDLKARIDEKFSWIEGKIKEDSKECINAWSSDINKEICIRTKEEFERRFGITCGQKMVMSLNLWDSSNRYLENMGVDADKVVDEIDVNLILGILFARVMTATFFEESGLRLPEISPAITVMVSCFVDDYLNNKMSDDGCSQKFRKWALMEMKYERRKKVVLPLLEQRIKKAIDSEVTDASVERDIELMIKNVYEIMAVKLEV